MSLTIAADIIDRARSTFLNDPNGNEVTNDRILPYLKEAYDFLQSELEANSVQCKNEEIIATILANVSEYLPPDNLVVPNTMFERTPGSVEEFYPMSFRMNLPENTPKSSLKYWTYRLDRVLISPANQDREIKLYYQKSFPAVESADTTLHGKAEQYLVAKTAALYNMFVRQSTTLASVCNDIAESELAQIISLQVKITQSQVIRPRGYMPGRNS